MNRAAKCIAALTAFTLSIGANVAARDQPAQAARLRTDVAVMASDAMMGRDPARPEFDEAARYVAERFAAAGLRPGAADGWFQPVPLVRYHPAAPGTATWTRSGTAPEPLQPGRDFFAEGDPTAPTQHVSAPVVFVGFGISAANHDDYRGIDVRGKIVAALAGGPDLRDPTDRALRWDQAAKRRAARARGAVGFVNVHVDRPGMASFATTAKAALVYSQWSWRTADDSGAGPAATPLLATLSDSGARKLFGARWRGAAIGTRADGVLTIDTATHVDPIPSRNVVGILPGRDRALAREVVIVSAHLDHIGVLPGDTGDRVNNGALDNAMGVAAMIDIARGMAGGERRPRRTMLFLALTGEEAGLLGSDYFAARPDTAIGTIVADINIDMPILTYRFEDLIAYGSGRSTLGVTIAKAARRFGTAVSPDPEPHHALYTRSDQFSFARRGVPSVMIWPGLKGPGAAATEQFMKSRYHRPSDDVGNAIQWDQAARYTTILSAIVRDVANADRRPAGIVRRH